MFSQFCSQASECDCEIQRETSSSSSPPLSWGRWVAKVALETEAGFFFYIQPILATVLKKTWRQIKTYSCEFQTISTSEKW